MQWRVGGCNGGVEVLRRRASVLGLCLVTAGCLFTLLLSQRMVASSLHSSSFLAIGRTIQSWSSSEMDGPSNITADIDMTIEEQRFHISAEMADYEYPNGKYNVSAKWLSDLVPELGGTPLRSIIITTWRSGSTFLGDVLNAHPANFYHYEPLLDYDIVQVRGAPLAKQALHTLRQLLNCTYADLDHYLEYGQGHNWLFLHNSRLWERCLMHPHICWLPEFLSPFCRLFPFQSMKVVRLRLSLAEELLADPNLNVRVMLLVRDPRGTMQSRRHRDWCPGRPDCWDPGRLCADLLADYSAAIRLARLYPNRFRAVRYEDLSLNPYSGVKELLGFFGLSFHSQVKAFLDTHTHTNAGGVSSTFRNSKATPYHWRADLSHQEVRTIQKVCRPAMKAWGYVLAQNTTHQRHFNPIAKSFKLV
ncbi:carbohydrate sulfotransferase 5 isoform X2 [Nilaparvata lugens]|nr:carbohydrate sulfotransferase 5 isoform X2 [Nilaparvata lugens]